MSLGLIITAAGASTRFGEPKQFVNIEGVPMLIKTLLAFKNIEGVTECVISINEEGRSRLEKELKTLNMPFNVNIVLGGSTRSESVENAVYALEAASKVLIHDGARPFVTEAVIYRVMKSLETQKAVIPGVSSVDTLKIVQNGIVQTTLNRDEVYKIQTPQGFDVHTLIQAYTTYSGPEATDEAMLIEKMGVTVAVVQGDEQNKKITFKSDCN